MELLIELKDVCKEYFPGKNEVKALNNISLCIYKGEFVSIVGSSGSGKSTMMNILGCLDNPSAGKYLLDGVDVSKLNDRKLSTIRNQKIGFIFQGFNLIPSMSALENVELPLSYRKVSASKRKALAKDALKEVGLNERMGHRPAEMSGGQQQRVAIARAIAARPSIILADEPTGNLDTKSGTEIMNILNGLHQEGRTIILITHDNEIANTAQRLIRISDGKLIENKKLKSIE